MSDDTEMSAGEFHSSFQVLVSSKVEAEVLSEPA